VLSNAIKILALPNVKTLDIGGGFASDPPEEVRARLSYPIDPIPQCVDAAVEELNAAFPDPGSRPDLLIEPGLGVLADTMEYFCRVVAIKPLDDRWAIITDGSMFEIDPFRGAIGPPTAPISSESTGVHTGRGTLYGSTCMEIDQLGDVADVSGIQVGDYVRTANVGAYAVSLAPEFIFRRAPVICVDTGRVVRERQESGHFTGSGA
jgi:diaminopimelate decarboxylase